MIMADYCLRCGKAFHKGKCVFDKTKKSVVEDTGIKMKSVLTDVDAIKKEKVK
jgi:hypothetical protein